jgi:hypothetical protein
MDNEPIRSDAAEVLFRDDQIDGPALRDEIRRLRKAGRSAALLDTGRFETAELEWLAKEGLRLYMSDEAGRSASDILWIGTDVRRAGGVASYFLGGTWDGRPAPNRPSFADLLEIGRSGIDLHVSNRERERDPGRLNELAWACREGGAWLVYYHAGPLGPWLEELAGCGAWIHVSEDSLSGDDDALLVRDAQAAARRLGFDIILHAPAARDIVRLKDLIRTGVLVLLETGPSDYRSPLRELETMAGKVRLGPRMYYLDANVLP